MNAVPPFPPSSEEPDVRGLPQDIEIEQALIGAVLVDNFHIKALGGLKADHFYDPAHGRLWEKIIGMAGHSEAATPLTLKRFVASDAGLTEIGGVDYLKSLAVGASAMPNVKDYAHILIELAVRREMIRIGEDIVNTAFEASIDVTAAAQIEAAENAMREVAKMATHDGAAFQARPFVWRDPKQIPPRAWLDKKRHLMRKIVSLTVGPGGIGKSTLAIHEALELVHSGLRVWYFNFEDPGEEIDRRIAATCQHYGIGRHDLDDRFYLENARDHPCIIAKSDRDGAHIVRPVVEKLVAELTQKQIDVLIIDPFVSSHKVRESDNDDIDMVVKEGWTPVADRSNAAVELHHHTRKLGDSEATAESARGAKALIDAGRSVRVLNQMTKEEGERAGVENHRLYFRLMSAKQNFTPPPDKSDWWTLKNVDLGNGYPGRSDEVGVAVSWQWPDPFDGMSTADLFAVQKRIAAAEWKENVQAKNWAGIAIAEHLKLDLTDPKQKARSRTLLKRWLASGALTIARKLDATRHECPFVEVGQWVVP